MLRHIAWFNEPPIAPDAEGALTSSNSTVSRRCLAPARELEELGVECSVFGNLHDADPVHVGKHLQKLQSDIVVIGKGTGHSLLPLARAAKHLGCYIVADFTGETGLLDFEALAALADQIVAASPAAAKMLSVRGLEATIIPDCDGNGEHTAHTVAQLWLDCFKKLKMKPPACANTNLPLTDNA